MVDRPRHDCADPRDGRLVELQSRWQGEHAFGQSLGDGQRPRRREWIGAVGLHAVAARREISAGQYVVRLQHGHQLVSGEPSSLRVDLDEYLWSYRKPGAVGEHSP